MIDTIIFTEINPENLIIFSNLFCYTIILKSITELSRGYWNYFRPNSYLSFLTNSGKQYKPSTQWIFRASIVIKISCSILILFNKFPAINFIFLILALFVELKYYFKYHVNLMFLYSIILCGFHFTISSKNTSIMFFPILIALTTSAVYIFTAFHKTNKVFLSGKVVLKTLELVNSSERFSFDFCIKPTSLFSTYLKKLLPIFMTISVVLEFILPILLLNEKTRLLGITLGILLHLGFTLLFPATLLHFSLLTTGSYLAFTYF